MKTFQLSVFVFLIPYMAFPDTVVLTDGSVYSGKIIESTEIIIKIETNKKTENFPKSDIYSIVLANADILHYANGQSIECKIIRKTGDAITVMTAEGEKVIDNSLIKNVQYNMGHELKLTSLPATDRHFKNNPNPLIRAGEDQMNIYLGGYFGCQYSFLDSWKKQFFTENGTHPSTSGLKVGGEIGIIKNKYIEFGAGFEYFFLPTVKVTATQPNFEDKVSSFFYYGALKIGRTLTKLPNMRVYGGIDLGLLNGIEKAQNMGGIDFEASSKVFAKCLKIGSSYFNGNSSYYFDIGYLMAKVTDVKLLGNEIPNYELDFSGIVLVSGYRYHFPLKKY
jgi:hypothetical protein